MPVIKSRIPFTAQHPYRMVRPATSKIIFLSCEGCVTEEEYFARISELYGEIESKIQFISVAEDAVFTGSKFRTSDQRRLLSRVRPKQLTERIDQFKIEKNDIYQFEKYPEDEFWIVTDVDQNWSDEKVSPKENKTFRQEWEETVAACQEKGYRYAISNPSFEVWLLLHHDDPSEEDKDYAVTDSHSYQKTSYFRERLRNLGAPLKDTKHIKGNDYNRENINLAVQRARRLHRNRDDLAPKYYATTVYLLIEKITEMVQ